MQYCVSLHWQQAFIYSCVCLSVMCGSTDKSKYKIIWRNCSCAICLILWNILPPSYGALYAERKNNLHCSHLCIHHLNDLLSIIMVQLDQLFIVITVCLIHWKSHRKKIKFKKMQFFSTGHKHLCFTVLPSLHLKKKTLIGWYFIPQLSILLLAKDAISSRFQKCFMVYWETSVLNDKYMSYDK